MCAKPIKPADIAKRLGISTSSLRHYEDWGIVPKVGRGLNGYRRYSERHVAYFECIRAMCPGFGMDATKAIMRCLVAGKPDEALWLVSAAQASLHARKQMADKTIQVLDTDALEPVDRKGRPKRMSIGEASAETSIPASAIRHWEKMGLLEPERDPENGYRYFGPAQIRRILIIGTLRSAVWSLETIREVIRELDHHNVEQARRIAREALRYLSELNLCQIRGIHYLHRLIEMTDQ